MTALLLTGVMGWLSWRGALRAREEDNRVTHTYAVLGAIQTASTHLNEMETSGRAFSLSGQTALLPRYEHGRDGVARDMAELQRLTSDSPSQHERAMLLTRQAVEAEVLSSRAVNQRKLGPYAAGADAVAIERSIATLDGTMDAMRSEETRLLQLRTQEATASRSQTNFLTAMGALVGVGFLLLAGFAINREINLTARARVQIGTLNAELADQKFALDQHAIVAITDVQGTITYVNQKFCAISQYFEKELLGQNHRILNSGHHPGEFFQNMYRTIAQGEVWQGEIQNRAKDGSLYWVDTTIVPNLTSAGKPRQYVAIRADITERKRTEAALEESRKNQIRFKDEFLSHVSHELRSPLTAIKQFTNILLGGMAGELNAEQREFQGIVLKNVLQLQRMIDDLLEVTRLETGKLSVEPEIVSLEDPVRDSIHTLQVSASNKGVSLACELPAGLAPAHADPTRLRQILIILMDNAVKFTPKGGSIEVRARRWPQDSHFLLLEVSDTGCGMSAEAAARIFERLYQVEDPNETTRKGLGLGLFICKELVTRQGGQIWVKSQPGEGTTFFLTVPVFSLANVLAPLLKDNQWPGESVVLIQVETDFLGGPPSPDFEKEWSQEIRALVGRCLLPGLDALLPRIGSGLERLYVAAFADERGAAVLAKRIREQFDRLPKARRSGLALSVSCRLLNLTRPQQGGLVDDAVTLLATQLEECIHSQIPLEVLQHE